MLIYLYTEILHYSCEIIKILKIGEEGRVTKDKKQEKESYRKIFLTNATVK